MSTVELQAEEAILERLERDVTDMTNKEEGSPARSVSVALESTEEDADAACNDERSDQAE